MILVTGGTGFIGKVLIRRLVEAGYPVRTLIRPSSRSPNLPRGVSVEVALSSLNDLRGLRASMVGVDTIYHLAGGEWRGPRANLLEIDIQGTRAVVEAALDARVERIFYLSHLGADRASAYPVLKTKAIAEEFVRRSGLDYTIVRTAIVFGENDGFTTGIAKLLSVSPGVFMLPGDGKTLLQPLWVEDLATCLTWALEDNQVRNQLVEVGGPEYLSLSQIVNGVMDFIGQRRRLIGVSPAYLRGLTVLLESFFPGLPVSVYWLDYLAVNRTCSLDTIPRVFNLMPSQMFQRLGYLREQTWRTSLLRSLLTRRM